MIYDLDVSDPSTYVKEFTSMSNKLKKKQKIVGSYGVGMPILGQSEDFSILFDWCSWCWKLP